MFSNPASSGTSRDSEPTSAIQNKRGLSGCSVQKGQNTKTLQIHGEASITHLGEGFVDLAILVHSSAVLRVSYLVDSCSVDLMEESLGIGGPRTQYGRPRFGVTSNCRRQGLGRVLLSRKRGLTPLPDYPYRVTPRAPVT